MKTVLRLSAVALATTLAFAPAAMAADEYNVANGLTLTGNPLGMHGVDPVSMFDSDAPHIGDAVHTSEHGRVDSALGDPESNARFQDSGDGRTAV